MKGPFPYYLPRGVYNLKVSIGLAQVMGSPSLWCDMGYRKFPQWNGIQYCEGEMSCSPGCSVRGNPFSLMGYTQRILDYLGYSSSNNALHKFILPPKF